MKKLLIVATFLSSFICLGCTSKKNPRLYTVAYMHSGYDSPRNRACFDSFGVAFERDAGYRLVIHEDELNLKTQIDDVRKFVIRGSDYIIINPIEETGWDSVLEYAKKNRVGIITCENRIKTNVKNGIICQIAGDFIGEAQGIVSWLKNFQGDKNNNLPEINMCVISGIPNSTSDNQRFEGLLEGVEKNSTWRFLAKRVGNDTEENGEDVTSYFLSKFPETNVIVAFSEQEAFGAINAIENAGKIPGKDVHVLSFGVSRLSLEYLESGKISCAVASDPNYGFRAESKIRLLNENESIDNITLVSGTVYSKYSSNIDRFRTHVAY